ncbi:MAG: 4Fe-4S dicluster domain-containing protein [Betaproteobacteria bacterium]|nr:4Fe-4S dicluster domain-containing protein [Betaproteobacteria bacterium]
MALFITDECINCTICELDCPNHAVFPGSKHYQIDPDRCTECENFFAAPLCQEICPADCIIPLS